MSAPLDPKEQHQVTIVTLSHNWGPCRVCGGGLEAGQQATGYRNFISHLECLTALSRGWSERPLRYLDDERETEGQED